MSIFGSQNTFLQTGEKKSTSKVGKDVSAYCSRCKLNLSHTILTVTADTKADRVRCNTCKTERSYRPPRKDIEASKGKAGSQSMTDRDEDFDLDTMEAAKALLGADGTKKKPKAKAKPKKEKSDAEPKISAKVNLTLPLSMQRGTAEDIASFETRIVQHKVAVANAKDYKATHRINPGEIINHKVFGIGFVVAENGLNKIEVLFKEGRKLLVTMPKG